jgi:hypothetical protein
MNIEYKIIYRIGQDIPINPAWIGDQIQAAIDALQTEINKKALHGTHTLELKLPEGWALPKKNKAPSGKINWFKKKMDRDQA